MCRYTSLPFYRVFGLRSAVWLSQPVSIAATAYQVLIITPCFLVANFPRAMDNFEGYSSSIDCRVADYAGHDERRLRHFRRSLVLGMQHLRIGHRSQLVMDDSKLCISTEVPAAEATSLMRAVLKQDPKVCRCRLIAGKVDDHGP